MMAATNAPKPQSNGAPQVSNLFSASKDLVVQTIQNVFSSKEVEGIETIARRVALQVFAERGYSSQKRNAQPKPMPGIEDLPPLPDNLQSMTVSVPTVVVNGAGTFYGWAESVQSTALLRVTTNWYRWKKHYII
jgi:hypothetical protein